MKLGIRSTSFSKKKQVTNQKFRVETNKDKQPPRHEMKPDASGRGAAKDAVAFPVVAEQKRPLTMNPALLPRLTKEERGRQLLKWLLERRKKSASMV